ncbi:hypothetical protein QQG74_09215 [Micromonospora sp. FIMYZ51]|uniref:hypothetical protein n=1 Tax=Micromonospora sp. FIMYZ51 TaxID=3051832 RepID=UPI00311F322A
MTAQTQPECPAGHGPMVSTNPRTGRASDGWEGVWRYCPVFYCNNSHLTPSPELLALLAEQKRAQAQGDLLAPAVSRG